MKTIEKYWSENLFRAIKQDNDKFVNRLFIRYMGAVEDLGGYDETLFERVIDEYVNYYSLKKARGKGK